MRFCNTYFRSTWLDERTFFVVIIVIIILMSTIIKGCIFFEDGGHQFILQGERRSLAGTIAFVSGDNLGSQLIGGFKELC